MCATHFKSFIQMGDTHVLANIIEWVKGLNPLTNHLGIVWELIPKKGKKGEF